MMELTKSTLRGLKVPSPDGRRYLINQKDADGIPQIYVGVSDMFAPPVCISNVQRPGGPSPNRMKMQANWHPSGKWILCAVEREVGDYDPGFAVLLGKGTIEGLLQCGIWTNMWAVSPDGLKWVKLSSYKSGWWWSSWFGVADGFTGPAFTPDGRKAVWSETLGDVLTYKPFGKWQLVIADWTEKNGIPTWTNKRTITPVGMSWNEPGNFHPDGRTVLLSGSTNNADQQGQDQYTLDVVTGTLKNLTNNPTTWDEHGVFSPDGSKILYMSSLPYQSEPSANTTLGIKTEFMLMQADGSNVQQLTRFRQPGTPEYHNGIAAIGHWAKDGESLQLLTLEFPNYHVWDLRL